ncbi:hypothetical protein GC174_08790 [bacterium]|nr:hypothetical protein [bacterium]
MCALPLLLALVLVFQLCVGPILGQEVQQLEIADDVQVQQPVRMPLRAIMCALEIKTFGKAKRNKGLLYRINHLEKKVFGSADYIQKEKSLDVRISDLVEKVKPSQDQFDQGFKICQDRIFEESQPNWFTQPPEVEWMNKLGRGIKRSGAMARETAGSTGKMLTSPEFITLVGAAAAIVGAYYLGKALNKGGGGGYYSGGYEHGCSGQSACQYCTNCKYCRWCNSGTTSYCGVWYSYRGYAIP